MAETFKSMNLWPQDFDYAIFDNTNNTLKADQTDSSLLLNQSTISINVKSASKKFVYAPYGAEYSGIDDNKIKPYFDSYVKLGNSSYSVNYLGFNGSTAKSWADFANSYPFTTNTLSYPYNSFTQDKYTKISKSDGLQKAYKTIKDKYLNGGSSYSDIYNAISNYFSSEYEYTLTPGITPDNEDFVDYFLSKQKKGYCTYFATAGAQLMRMFGYPARYVEGYMVLPSQFNEEEADADGDYTIKVKDQCAHAWAEVYIENVGWIPAEFTPGYKNSNPNLTEEQTTKKNTETKQTTKTEESSKTETVSDSSSAASQSDNNNNQTNTATVTSTVLDNNAPSDSESDSSGTGEGVNTESTSDSGIAAGKTNINKDNNSLTAVILSVVCVAFIVAVILIHRKYVLNKKNFSCTQADCNERVKSILQYIISYLKLINVHSDDNISDMQLCSQLTKLLLDKNINIAKDLHFVFELAEKAYMSNNEIDEKDAQRAYEIMENIANDVVYKNLNAIKRFSAKFGNALY